MISFSGTDIAGSVTFRNFSVTSSEFVLSAAGSASWSDSSGSGFDRSVLNGTSLVISVAANGQSISVANYNEVYEDHYASSYELFDVSYEANASALNGSFLFDTLDPLVQLYSQNYPYPGQVLITGASNSKVRATSEGGSSSSMVHIEVDADGDGVYEFSVRKTWSEIDAEASL